MTTDQPSDGNERPELTAERLRCRGAEDRGGQVWRCTNQTDPEVRLMPQLCDDCAVKALKAGRKIFEINEDEDTGEFQLECAECGAFEIFPNCTTFERNCWDFVLKHRAEGCPDERKP